MRINAISRATLQIDRIKSASKFVLGESNLLPCELRIQKPSEVGYCSIVHKNKAARCGLIHNSYDKGQSNGLNHRTTKTTITGKHFTCIDYEKLMYWNISDDYQNIMGEAVKLPARGKLCDSVTSGAVTTLVAPVQPRTVMYRDVP